MSWNQILQNPKSYTLKKFLANILDNKVNNYDDLLARIGVSLVTDNDLKVFAELVNDIYVAGFSKAIEDNKKQLNDLGFVVTNKEENQEKLGW